MDQFCHLASEQSPSRKGNLYSDSQNGLHVGADAFVRPAERSEACPLPGSRLSSPQANVSSECHGARGAHPGRMRPWPHVRPEACSAEQNAGPQLRNPWMTTVISTAGYSADSRQLFPAQHVHHPIAADAALQNDGAAGALFHFSYADGCSRHLDFLQNVERCVGLRFRNEYGEATF